MKYQNVAIIASLFFGQAMLAAPQRYRVSALECQGDGHFVLVSTFNTGQMLLSWGLLDDPVEIDIPVRLQQENHLRRFFGRSPQGDTVNLSAIIPIGADKGVARLKVESRTRTMEWNQLNCELFAED